MKYYLCREEHDAYGDKLGIIHESESFDEVFNELTELIESGLGWRNLKVLKTIEVKINCKLTVGGEV